MHTQTLVSMGQRRRLGDGEDNKRYTDDSSDDDITWATRGVLPDEGPAYMVLDGDSMKDSNTLIRIFGKHACTTRGITRHAVLVLINILMCVITFALFYRFYRADAIADQKEYERNIVIHERKAQDEAEEIYQNMIGEEDFDPDYQALVFYKSVY